MHELKLFDDNCIDSEQVVLEVFAVTEELSIDSEKVTEMVEPIGTDDAESDGEVELTVGEVVSITNELIFNVTLLLELSVTVIVQSEYVPSLKETKVIVLFPLVADVVPDEQEPP